MVNYDLAREVLLKEVKESKKTIISQIECSTRDYDLFEIAYARYKSCLQAADKLCDMREKEK